MTANARDILIGVIGGLIVELLVVAAVFSRARLRAPFRLLALARVLHGGGVTGFYLSREDYSKRRGGAKLISYLSQAKSSIDIVALNLLYACSTEDLPTQIVRLLQANTALRVRISLPSPDSPVIHAVAPVLGLASGVLRKQVATALSQLYEARTSLSVADRARFRLLLHNCVPMGGAILIDATPTTGRIQVESKLFSHASSDSFGFEIESPALDKTPSSFYSRHYMSWTGLLDTSRDVEPHDLVVD